MRREDPLRVTFNTPKTKTIFAASQVVGTRERQEDFFLTYNDECIALADGVGGMPHGDVAARLACETAVWAYRHVRLRPTYWKYKKIFLNRIFRTANIALWHKHREDGFAKGLATTLVVCILSDRQYWIGSAGDSRGYLLHDGALTLCTKDDVDASGKLTKVMGVARYGLVPRVVVGPFMVSDTILLATDGTTRWVSEEELTHLMIHSGSTAQSLTNTVSEILERAKLNGSTDNMTAMIIKKIRLD